MADDNREYVVMVNLSQYAYVDAEAFGRATHNERCRMLYENVMETLQETQPDIAIDGWKIEETRDLSGER